MYRVEVKRRAERALERLPSVDRDRIFATVRKLANDPRPRSALKIQRNVYRVRVGSYRVLYAVSDSEDLIIVGKIAHREKDTYEHLEELF